MLGTLPAAAPVPPQAPPPDGGPRRGRGGEAGRVRRPGQGPAPEGTGDLADAHTEALKGLLHFHGALERFTEEDWAKLTPDSRQEMWNLLVDLRADAPGWLAKLPIEERRKLEGGRGEAPDAT